MPQRGSLLNLLRVAFISNNVHLLGRSLRFCIQVVVLFLSTPESSGTLDKLIRPWTSLKLILYS